MEFRWNTWNVEHVARHGVRCDEAEWITNTYRATRVGEGKYRVRGRTTAGRYLQVVFILDPDDTVCVIHARPLTDREKRSERRRER